MGATCTVLTGLLVAAIGAIIWADEWVDEDKRWIALVACVTLGVGTILHALGVW